jgi:molecular chaperone GrpE
MNTKKTPETDKQKTQSKSEKKEGNDELLKAQEEVAHWKDLAMRATAEMENLRKRTQIDIEKSVRYANGSFAKDLLPVADCLEQALTYANQELEKGKESGTAENPILTNLIKGVEMTHTNLITALKKQQIEKMTGLGQVFDPNLHKVIQEVDDSDKPAGTIVQELQTGYTIGGDRVLREAMVIVSK